MNKNKQDTDQTEVLMEPQELLLDLYTDYIDVEIESPWAWETERWHELVFCILTTLCEPTVLADTTRSITDLFADMGLLELETLAQLKAEQTDARNKSPLIVTIKYLLQQAGFNQKSAEDGIIAICEAAASIQEKYDGKVQLYLRKYGNYMLEQAGSDFSFSLFEKSNDALALWLQNTLNMPIPLHGSLTARACQDLDVTYEQLLEAADILDINVALLDDALRRYWEATEEASEPMEQEDGE